MEPGRPAIQNDKEVPGFMIAKYNKLECSEYVGDIVKTFDNNIANEVYKMEILVPASQILVVMGRI